MDFSSGDSSRLMPVRLVCVSVSNWSVLALERARIASSFAVPPDTCGEFGKFAPPSWITMRGGVLFAISTGFLGVGVGAGAGCFTCFGLALLAGVAGEGLLSSAG